MFSSKELNVKLVYMFFGGMIAIVGMLFGIGLLPSVTAERGTFDAIQCSRLEVVDADGETRIILRIDGDGAKIGVAGKGGTPGVVVGTAEHGGGAVGVYSRGGEPAVLLSLNEHGGQVMAYGKDGNSRAAFSIDEHGGIAGVHDKDGRLGVVLNIRDHGGETIAYGKDGNSRAGLGIAEHGGKVAAYGTDGKSVAALRLNEHGGRVGVTGKGEGRAVMGINVYGNGAVSTYDKNGYLQKTVTRHE